ncbi:MAG TPA: helicase C-terminal domain-containing protein [Coriobacteriia bacterium]|jgi:ATP-dependent DNA helicase DinG
MTPPLDRFLVPGTDAPVARAYASLSERAADAVFGFEDEIAVLDVETTGFDPGRDAVIEIAVLVARGPEVIERYSTLVDPGRAIAPETTQLTGIDDAMVAGMPTPVEALERAAEVVGSRDVVAHNADFDRSFLLRSDSPRARALSGTWIDSLELARIALPRLRSHRLRDLAEAFELPGDVCHRAPGDVEATFALWRLCLQGLHDLPAEVVAAIAALAPEVDWPLRGTLAHAAAASKAPRLDLKHLRREQAHIERAETLLDAADCDLSAPSAEEVLSEFSAEGLVGRMYPGFERRGEQLEMAEAVLDAFGGAHHLAVEAGTGVGKSVAYLLPAALFALENHVGVGVATKTNALTDQLVYGELPALAEQLGGKLRYVSLKGYEHYPCLRKLERLATGAGIADREALATVASLLAWVAQTSWGELDALNVHWPPGLRQQVACSTEECTKRHCRFHPNLCYVRGIRKKAACAHVVVTNHALLFRDAASEGGILPPLRYWVVDEAHSAEAEARRQLSLGASRGSLRGLLGGLHAAGRGGLLTTLRGRMSTAGLLTPHGEEVLERATSETASAATIAESFFDFLKDLRLRADDGGYDRREARLSPELRESSEWSYAEGTGRALLRRLDAVVVAGRELVTLTEEAGDDLAELRATLVMHVSQLSEQYQGLATVLDGSDETFVYSVTVDRRREVAAEHLSASTLDVGEVLLATVYPNVHSIVYTSATVAAGDDFSHFLRGVGLDRLPEGSVQTLRLASSYDFERQMAVFVPTDVAEPGQRAYLGDLERLLLQVHEAMGGSVLTLFTNRREMETLYAKLAGPLRERGLPLIAQGAGVSRKRLRDEFLADERLSLFATKSFWEGFDAPGDTLRCVVVAKLPFGQMSDPLYEERRTRDPKAWDRYYLPEAIIDLKQAAGRLIRTSTDEGCVVIADARLAGPKGYARKFLAALPVRDVEMLPAERIAEEVARRFGR